MKPNRRIFFIILLIGTLWIPIHPNLVLAKNKVSLESIQSFDPGYDYKIYRKGIKDPLQVSGSQLSKSASGLTVETKEGTLNIEDQDIERIKGRSRAAQGSQVLKGVMYGGITGAVLGLVPAVGFLSKNCNDFGEDVGDCRALKGVGGIFLAGGIGAGVLIGAGVGALIPKHPKIQITPTIQPGGEHSQLGFQLSGRF